MTDSKGLSMNRPSIKSYANRVWSSEKYHNFPTNMDKTIVSQGLYVTHNGASGFVYPGYVDGKMGYYNIILDSKGVVIHRMFYPINKAHQIWVGSRDFKLFSK